MKHGRKFAKKREYNSVYYFSFALEMKSKKKYLFHYNADTFMSNKKFHDIILMLCVRFDIKIYLSIGFNYEPSPINAIWVDFHVF